MSDWAVVFLGIIALGSLTQTVFMVALGLQAKRLAVSLDQLRERVEKQIKPSLESVARVTRNLAEISDLGVLQARRIDATLADTLDKVETTTEAVRRIVLKPLGPLGELAAVVKGVRRGLEVYGQLRGFERSTKGASRTYAEDEHLFI